MANVKISELPLYVATDISDGAQAFAPLDDLTVGTSNKTKRLSFSELCKYVGGNLPRLVVNSGTLTASAPLTLSQGWNAGAVVFGGVQVKITDSASAAGSKPFEVLGGGAGATSLMSVDKAGSLNLAGTLSVAGTPVAAFKTISVSGQSDVVADSIGDTLTIAAGSNITITTDASTDTVTIAAAGGNVPDGDYGDVSISSGVWSVDPGAITYSKIQNVSATARILGRFTAGAGVIEEGTAAQVRTLLNVADGAEANQNAFSTIAVSGQTDVVADQESDTLTLAAGNSIGITTTPGTDTVTIAVSDGDKGDISISSGVWSVDAGAITYAKIQNVSATNRIMGRITAGAGSMEELTAANVRTIINVEDGADVTGPNFGTVAVSGQTSIVAGTPEATLTIAAGTNVTIDTNGGAGPLTISSTGGGGASNSFATISVSGQSDVIADSATDTLTLAAGNRVAITTNAGTDTITLGVADGDWGDFTLSSGTATLDNNVVTLAKLADIATSSFLGRATASTGDPEVLTATQARTILNVADGAEVNQNAFTTVAVSGQSDVVADAKTDTLTLAAGNAIGITTNATTDTVTIAVADGDRGDITVSGATWTVDAQAITYAKIQNVSATSRILGRITAGAGTIEELTAANVRTLINVADGADVSPPAFGTIAVSGQSNVVADTTNDTLTLVAGSNVTITTNAGSDSITIASTGGGGGLADGDYGDVTVGGSGTTITIDAGAVTYSKIQNVSATSRILGRFTAGAGSIEEGTAAQVRAVIETIAALPADNATPSVAGVHAGTTANTVSTAYTNFTGGVTGQYFELHLNDANSSVTNNSNLALIGGANIPASSSPKRVAFRYDGTQWVHLFTADAAHQLAQSVDGSGNITLANTASNADLTISVNGTGVVNIVADDLTLNGSPVGGGGGLPSGGSVGDLVVNTGSGTGAWSSVLSVGSNGATITGGTVTNPATTLSITQTWNDAADTFIGLDVSIDNDASAAASRLFRVRGSNTGTAERFYVDDTGLAVASLAFRGPVGNSTNPTFQFGATTTAMYYDTGSEVIRVREGNIETMQLGRAANISVVPMLEKRYRLASTAGVGAPNAIAEILSATVYTNEGSTAKNYHTLPGAASGLTYTFICQDADGIRVTAASGDTIRLGNKVTAAAGFVESTTIGDTLTIVAINATEWVMISGNGTWTDGTFTWTDVSAT